jgi:methylated-DNA-[protein]-cysteine S-methyltransferase
MKRHVILTGEKLTEASEPLSVEHATTPSPLGNILLTGYRDALIRLDITNTPRQVSTNRSSIMKSAVKDLDEYFEGSRRHSKLPFHLIGTEFQISVWRELTRIPYGEVARYGEIAERVGRPKAVRAVGQACGANPIAILIPCHRVVSSNGLGGFGLGLGAKRWLLGHESVEIRPYDGRRDRS